MPNNFPAFRRIPYKFVVSFLLWIFMFRGFLLNQRAFVLDAIQYYRSIEFYLTNMSQGVYPLWDPGWYNGVPWEFFLRRIGNYNPLFLIMLVLHKLGLPFLTSYLWFMAGYYFLGMIGFYLLAKRLVRDERAAFLGFLLLMFSSLGTMLYWSYIQLIFVPYFWFFYFLVAFSQEPKPVYAWGLTFCTMVILTTYIPFYFVTIFLSFLILFFILYGTSLPLIAVRYGKFVRQHALVSLFCVCCIGLALVPGYRLYKHSATGELSLPARQQEAGGASMFTVSARNIEGGDITSQLYFDRIFSDHQKIGLGVVYVPITAFLVLLLGVVTPLNKRMVLLALWASIILLMSLTTATPLYGFLNKHVFYFKYIRQFYYFFWVMILPVLILVVAEQTKLLLNIDVRNRPQLKGLYIIFAHAALFLFLLTRSNATVTSYLVIILSLIFCLLLLKEKIREIILSRHVYWIFLLLVALQPLETYSYLNKNATPSYFRGKDSVSDLSFKYQLFTDQALDPAGNDLSVRGTQIYYCTRWYYQLFTDMKYALFNDYRKNQFILYDDVEVESDDQQALKKLEDLWARRENRALIAQAPPVKLPLRRTSSPPQVITQDDASFSVADFNVNQIRIKTDFADPRFLVFNSNYHSGWQAFVNGTRIPIFRTNVAFKGIFLPSGANTVIFRFLKTPDYLFEYFYAVLFAGVFIVLIISAVRSKQEARGV